MNIKKHWPIFGVVLVIVLFRVLFELVRGGS